MTVDYHHPEYRTITQLKDLQAEVRRLRHAAARLSEDRLLVTALITRLEAEARRWTVPSARDRLTDVALKTGDIAVAILKASERAEAASHSGDPAQISEALTVALRDRGLAALALADLRDLLAKWETAGDLWNEHRITPTPERITTP